MDAEFLKRRADASKILRYDDASLKNIDPYEYQPLGDMRRRMRLLRLCPGRLDDATIDVELLQVEFTKRYEPMMITGGADGVGEATNVKIDYEALSWCWGRGDAEHAIRIKKNSDVSEDYYKLRAKKELVLALKHLRGNDKSRIIWIDAICINQENLAERSAQVQMMSMIYTRASLVCVWLGEGDNHSNRAINFITNQIMHLERFDSITKDDKNTDDWQALMYLMQRPWFQRRWVVQEIALACDARIYCGLDNMSWGEFAVAVELFVEVETVTHRLSEVIQKDKRFFYIPDWFEYVSELGASRLVSATAKVFRATEPEAQSRAVSGTEKHYPVSGPAESATNRYESSSVGSSSSATMNHTPDAANGPTASQPPPDNPQSTEQSTETSEEEDSDDEQTVDPQGRRGLLSLEYLVSTLSTFEATDPRDTIYALLAVARDTTPFAEPNVFRSKKSADSLVMDTLSSFLQRKPYRVDYRLPYSDVCKEFISFCIDRSKAVDPSRSLDILCRPWALPPLQESTEETLDKSSKKRKVPAKEDDKSQPTKGIVDSNGKRVKLYRRPKGSTDKTPSTADYWNMVKDQEISIGPKLLKFLPVNMDGQVEKAERDIELPTWVASIENAPFGTIRSPGIKEPKTGRKNADSLVGHPEDGHRNYSAAQTRPPEDDSFKLAFRKRPFLGHYSFYVKGFVLDEIAHVESPALGPSIPKSWTEAAGWTDFEKDPPDEFVRALVADRGKGNRNPPYYYRKACKESINKGSVDSGRVDIGGLINREQNSIITEFCRRVQEVVWNRRLIRTKRGTLGLAGNKVKPGDLICIIYGCSVPVILRRHCKDGGLDEVAASDIAAPTGPAEEMRNLDKLRMLIDLVKEKERLETSGAAEKGGYASLKEKIDDVNSKVSKSATELTSFFEQRIKEAEVDNKKTNDPDELAHKQAAKMVKEEELHDSFEDLKSCIRRLEIHLVQKARYEELKAKEVAMTFTKRKMSGAEYEKYIQKATTIVNGYLQQRKNVETSRASGENQAKEELKKLAQELRLDACDESQVQTTLNDKYYYYNVIGESYIHGMMDGEAIRVRLNEKPLIPQQIFELR